MSHRIEFMSPQRHTADLCREKLALSPLQATTLASAVFAVAAAAAWFFLPSPIATIPLGKTAGIPAAIGYAGFYHVHYGNMMLSPLPLALVAAGLCQRSRVLFICTAPLGIICYPDQRPLPDRLSPQLYSVGSYPSGQSCPGPCWRLPSVAEQHSYTRCKLLQGPTASLC